MEFTEKYLNMNPEDIDKLLLGFDLDSPDGTVESKNTNRTCINCGSLDLILDESNCLVCNECAVINSEYLDRNPEYNKDNNKGSSMEYLVIHIFPNLLWVLKLKQEDGVR